MYHHENIISMSIIGNHTNIFFSFLQYFLFSSVSISIQIVSNILFSIIR